MRHWIYSSATAVAAFAGAASVQAADPVPKVGPAPAWVTPLQVPAPDPKLKSQPAQYLVLATQERFSPTAVETHFEYEVVAQNTAGLQAAGTITLPWNTERTDLTIHQVAIRRAGKVIDLLDPEEMVILRRENNLEKAMLDGVRTVVIPARGLRIGDHVRVAVTYKTKPSSLETPAEDVQAMKVPAVIGRLERTFLVPDDVAVKWYRSPGVGEPATASANGMKSYRFVTSGEKEREFPTGTPDRFKGRFIQASAWRDWAQVAGKMEPLYREARVIAPGSQLAEEADRIAAATKDPSQRMLAALRLAQEQVRYVALLLGEGAYVPKSAEEVWDRRFGDCKGKTALLLALLDRMGVAAEPMLVSYSSDDSLGLVHPTLALFDHVIVRARIGGQTYYLDATDYGQRTLDELARTSFRNGLPLASNVGLVKLESGVPSQPLVETEVEWDGRQGFERKVPFTARLILRGEKAAELRAKRAVAEDEEKFVTGLKNLVPGIANDVLTLEAEEPERPDGSYAIAFTGTAAMDWSKVDGRKGHRFEFNQNGVKWEADFERAKDENKELPVVLQWPYFQRATEAILLPGGGKGFRIDGGEIERRFSGLHISRSVTLDGGKAVARSDFRHVGREISADDARAAEKALAGINESYAYVIAPGRIRPVPEEGESKD